ncbi:MAG: alpha-L-fucosidase [Bacteroidetes bacterium]|nr:alpha-L-fucosidase [Bacteroidota bacterium]
MKSGIFTKIGLISLLALVLTLSVNAQQGNEKATDGKFKPTDASLKQYQYPKWFLDAKFGIWAHWGPQAVPRQGDWYARQMYEEGSADYKYHVAHYGHPSKFGYKDIIPLWKAQKWNPEQLMALYKKAGAKYFVSMGTHHDNFFLWNSKIHKWNAVNMGPQKDVVGIWQKAAQKEGLRFGVSEHLGASYTWYQPSHGADKTGPMTGVAYDGADPKYADLYHNKTVADDKGWLTNNPENQKEWLSCIEELIDNYHPDLLYSDSGLPFGDVGREMIAHYYNEDLKKNGGKLEAVYNCKESSEGRWTQDIERGVMDSISPYPWQTDTSIGDWFYRTGQKYKSSLEIIQMLVDIVSKNGNLLINIVQTPEGDLEPDMLKTLEDIGDWTKVNGEGIYGTRPWKVFGERPAQAESVVKRNRFDENFKFSAKEIRFTTKGNTLYAFCLGIPTEDIRILSLGKNSKLATKAIASVKLLGSKAKVEWKQESDALVISIPANTSAVPVSGFKIEFKK